MELPLLEVFLSFLISDRGVYILSLSPVFLRLDRSPTSWVPLLYYKHDTILDPSLTPVVEDPPTSFTLAEVRFGRTL